MPKPEPVAQRRYCEGDPRPKATWAEALRRLESADTFWLATSRPDGRPHLMPLLAVSFDGRLYFCAGPSTQKARNLAREERCVLTTATKGMDLVVEGRALRSEMTRRSTVPPRATCPSMDGTRSRDMVRFKVRARRQPGRHR